MKKQTVITAEDVVRLQAVLLNNIPGCVALILQKDSREIVASNELGRELGGVPGRTCYETFAAREDPCPFCRAPELWTTGEIQRVEVEYRGVWYEGIWAPLSDDTYVHYIFDISDQVRAKREWQQSHDLLAKLTLQVPDVIYQFRRTAGGDYSFPWASPAMAAIFEVAPEDVRGDASPVIDRVHPDDVSRVVSLIEESARTLGTFHCEYRVELPGQGLRWHSSRAQPERTEDGGTLWHGIISDITERRRIEREREITSHAIEHAGVGMIRLDRSGRIREANEHMCAMLGYAREELLDLTVFDITAGLDPAVWPERWNDLRERGPVTHEKDYRCKNGSVVPVEISSSIVEFEGEELDHGFIRDISERKEAERALRERDQKLRQSQKMEAIGRLAGGIAHDFNNLLTAILGYSDLLLQDPSLAGLPAVDDIQEIRDAAERAGGLTRQILAFSRKQNLQPEILSLNDLIRGMKGLLRRTLGEDIELFFELASDLWLTEVDPHQFDQVLMNLAVNARDAMPAGGRLTLLTGNVWLDEHTLAKGSDAEPGEYVRLAVSDTGTGIEPEAIPLIFEPFYTTKAPGEGTGLGLPTAYGIIRQSGGTMDVESTPGEGTTFHVLLPRAMRRGEPAGAVAPGTDGTPGVGSSWRVLLVEDEEAVRGLIERVLRELGHTVLSVGEGPDALALIDDPEVSFDLLLTDVVLPGGMNGGEIARAARRMRSDLPVIFMSGYTRSVDLEGGLGADVVHYLAKPFTAEELRDTIGRAMGETGAR